MCLFPCSGSPVIIEDDVNATTLGHVVGSSLIWEQKQLAPGRRHETWAPGGMFILQLLCIEARLEWLCRQQSLQAVKYLPSHLTISNLTDKTHFIYHLCWEQPQVSEPTTILPWSQRDVPRMPGREAVVWAGAHPQQAQKWSLTEAGEFDHCQSQPLASFLS